MLAWIDLETTGTEEKLDPIIEVGMIVTDEKLCVLAERTITVRPNGGEWVERIRANPVVRDMHAANDLAAEVLLSVEALTPLEAEFTLIEILEAHGKAHDFMLAGSGVAHFDRRFLKQQMPQLEAFFRYPVLDVGVIRRALKLADRDDLIPSQPKKNHRAIDDIRQHLEEMRAYDRLFRAIPADHEEESFR